ncbi:MAG TPA: hypothetical protein PJ992_03910 [Arachnia sp.]|nr:hypothetical protein [Arachnia sp.]HMR13136.1 hypothetical protein [Arachnia sp.]
MNDFLAQLPDIDLTGWDDEDDTTSVSIRVYCSGHRRRQVLVTEFQSDYTDYGRGVRSGDWRDYRHLSRRQAERSAIALPALPNEFTRERIQTRPSTAAAVADVDGGRIVYMLQCPRCSTNARLRADVLDTILDTLVSTGNSSVTLQYLNRLHRQAIISSS